MNSPSSRHLVAPELRDVLDIMPPLDFGKMPLDLFRQGMANRQMPPLPPALAAVSCEERYIPGAPGDPDVRILLYVPPGEPVGLRPGLLEIHGGGFVIGSADMSDPANRMLALQLGCVVVAVDYRLAPETPWPGARDDNYAALRWLANNAASLNVDPARIAISGGSAGGGHAAALALHVRNLASSGVDVPAICFQLLDFPMLDDRTCVNPDPHPFTGEFVWTAERNHFGWKALLGVEPGSEEVDETAAPARATDLSDLPPTFIQIGALDLFLEESLEYVRRLTRAGVAAELHVIPGAYHGSVAAYEAPQSQLAADLRLKALARALGVALSSGSRADYPA